MQTFGEQLTAARKARGMTQDALAKAAAVTRQTISSWERGRTVPDIDTVRRLSDILGVDLIQASEGQSAAPAVETALEVEGQTAPVVETASEVEGQTAPAAAGKRQFKKWWMIAGAAALVCVVLLVFLLFPRKPAPAGGGGGFNAEYYQQETPNEAGKAYIAFDNRIWDETGDNSVYRCYEFKMFEKNGVGFTITQVEVEHEGKSGTVRSATLNASDMKASGINGDIAPYGSTTISGGFPKGEFLRCGIAVYGNDANGAPLTFYSLIEF